LVSVSVLVLVLVLVLDFGLWEVESINLIG
jgi:hypothetical protein